MENIAQHIAPLFKNPGFSKNLIKDSINLIKKPVAVFRVEDGTHGYYPNEQFLEFLEQAGINRSQSSEKIINELGESARDRILRCIQDQAIESPPSTGYSTTKTNKDFEFQLFTISHKRKICYVIFACQHTEKKTDVHENIFRDLFKHAPDMILISNNEGRYIEANIEACKKFGFSYDQFLNLGVKDIFVSSVPYKNKSTDSKNDFTSKWDAFKKDGSEFGVARCLDSNNNIISLEYHAIANFIPGYHLSVMRDVDHINNFYKSLRSKDLNFVNLLSMFPDYFLFMNMEMKLTEFFTASGKQLFKNTSLEKGMGLSELFSEEVQEKINQNIPLADKNRSYISFEYRHHTDCQEKTVKLTMGFFSEYEIILVIQDVTEETIRRKNLEKAQSKLTVLLTNSLESTMMFNEDYKLIGFNSNANQNAKNIFGKELREGTSVFDFVIERDRKTFLENSERAFRGEKVYVERTFTDHDGKVLWFGFSYQLIPLDQIREKCVILNVLNVTQRKHVEAAILENEKKYRLLFDLSPMGVGIVSSEGALEEINQKFLDILGSPSNEETLKINVLQFPSLRKSKFSSTFRKVLKENRSISNFQKHTSKWGKTVFIKFHISPLSYRNGKVEKLQVILEDYTGLHKTEMALKTSESRYRDIFENAHIGIFQTTLDGTFLSANTMQAKIFGFENIKRLMEISDDTVLYADPKDKQKFLKILERDGTVENFEYKIVKPNGETGWINTTARLVRKMNQCIIEGFNQDITDAKEKSEYHKALEVREKTSKLKDQFLANMSHEIRTPVTGILGMSEVLSETSLDSDQQNYLQVIRDSSSILLDLINDILDLAKIEAGKLELFPERFDLREFMKKISSMFEHQFIKKNVQFHISIHEDVPEFFVTDTRRLKQVLINLLGNALKFTDTGYVSVKISKLEDNAGNQVPSLLFRVRDTGAGISENYQKQIFEKFEQITDNYVKQAVGTGLGLPITKELVKLLGGEIGLESKPGEGSLFWFSVASQKETHQGVNEFTSAEVSKTNQTFTGSVLVVEDKKTNQLVVKLMLTRMGCDVTIVSNGQQAADTFDPYKFDLVLMDIFMPVMDGFTALRTIREKHGNSTPVIALSANTMEGVNKDFIEAGFDDFVSKPYTKAQLRAVLTKWLKNKPIS